MTHLFYPGIGILYTVPSSGWMAVTRRVQLAIQAQPVANVMSQVMPSYPALLAASQDWRGNVFPALAQQAAQVAVIAMDAVAQLGSLKQSLATAPKTGPLAQLVADEGQALLAHLRTNAMTMAALSGPLVPALQRFAEVNVNIDLELDKFQAPLGASWPPLGEQLALVETALGRTVGGWTALVSDLNDASTSGISLDLPQLLELDLDGAIASWTEIAHDAGQFANFAHTLQGAA